MTAFVLSALGQLGGGGAFSASIEIHNFFVAKMILSEPPVKNGFLSEITLKTSMRKITFSVLFLLPFSSFAAENCTPIHKSDPIKFSVSAKKDKNTLNSSSLVARGNKLSPVQPSEKLNYAAGTLAFALIPVASCKEGVQVILEASQNKKQQLLVWDEPTIIDGANDSEYFVKVTASKIKP